MVLREAIRAGDPVTVVVRKGELDFGTEAGCARDVVVTGDWEQPREVDRRRTGQPAAPRG